MHADLPTLRLAELPGGPQTLVLCASSRLAAELRRAHGEAQRKEGRSSWQALHGGTPAQWLDHLTSAALLRGEIPPASVPGAFLTWPQERALWEQAVAREGGAAAELFDRDGMALAAMEADSLQHAWRLEIPAALATEESRALQRWQAALGAACAEGGWRTAREALAWRIDCVARGLSGLPQRVALAGFTAPDPVLARLLLVLEARGIELFTLDFSHAGAGRPAAVALADAASECRAAAQWARDWLARAPQARLRIAVADLPARQHLLARALDAALHPAAVGTGWAGSERDWAFAAGTPLAEAPGAALALELLGLFARPQRVSLAAFGAALCGAGWSADLTEADGRARLDARLRELLPPECSLERIVRAVARLADDCAVPQLAAQLVAVVEVVRGVPRRQAPGAWGAYFAQLLELLRWPGERAPLAVEAEAAEVLRQLLAGLATLDAVSGRIDVAAALRLTLRLARDTGFAPRRQRPARVAVSNLVDALGGPVDGLWLMGLNEGVWPPLPRPNPLLPADLLRRIGVPTARADMLAVQAVRLQSLLGASAGEVLCSYATAEGERALRPSPLLADVPRRECVLLPGADAVAPLQAVDDAQAPPVAAAERVSGGTWLLQAQAVCPAWGFYRYRLGAKALETPRFGLDVRARGSLLHSALEAFWQGRRQADLLALDAAARAAALAAAVAHALAVFEREAAEPLPPRLAALEGERLTHLLDTWLAVEAERVPFAVLACEAEHKLDIEGLPVRVVIDRIDELDDGRLVIVDYKSGRSASAESWADVRIGEPQLPIYAALAFPDRAVAAVVLARVVSDAPAFVGLAEEGGLLPEVKPLDDLRRRYTATDFPDWAALRRLWAERIRALAREVRDGEAAVRFARESDLDHCEVRPLLRVAERRRQWEGGI